MVEYTKVNVKLTNLQLNKLKKQLITMIAQLYE